jgi:multiple sugar transport system substrate-binding protein
MNAIIAESGGNIPGVCAARRRDLNPIVAAARRSGELAGFRPGVAASFKSRRLAGIRHLTTVLSLLSLSACGAAEQARTVVEFWAMGREGEWVQALLPEFEAAHPGIRVKVQQIPWSAAHEKLLTAYAGDALPDVIQLGNTWIPEFVALRAIAPLDSFLATSNTLPGEDFFPGILAANRLAGQTFGIPWYVDTRVLFYRKDLLARAGISGPPQTRDQWLKALARIKAMQTDGYASFLSMNEWQVPVILALQNGAALLRDGARYGNFQAEPFRLAFRLYLEVFRRGYAPAAAESQLANLNQEFAAGRFVFLVSGPWNLGEFRRRLPANLQDQWTTAPLFGPDGQYPGASLAGGSSLALVSTSRHRAGAWELMEFLTQPRQQLAFYRLSGDLPSRRSAWNDPALAQDERALAFARQLEHLVLTPQIPEWERIAAKISLYAELAVRGELSEDEALSRLDGDADAILEKRRWLLSKAGTQP